MNLTQLLSRKFLVILSTIGVLLGGQLDSLHAVIVGSVAAVYVVAQAFVDRRTVEEIARAAEEGIRRGRAAGEIPPLEGIEEMARSGRRDAGQVPR